MLEASLWIAGILTVIGAIGAILFSILDSALSYGYNFETTIRIFVWILSFGLEIFAIIGIVWFVGGIYNSIYGVQICLSILSENSQRFVKRTHIDTQMDRQIRTTILDLGHSLRLNEMTSLLTQYDRIPWLGLLGITKSNPELIVKE